MRRARRARSSRSCASASATGSKAPSACSPVARPSRCVEQAGAAAIRSWRWPPPGARRIPGQRRGREPRHGRDRRCERRRGRHRRRATLAAAFGSGSSPAAPGRERHPAPGPLGVYPHRSDRNQRRGRRRVLATPAARKAIMHGICPGASEDPVDDPDRREKTEVNARLLPSLARLPPRQAKPSISSGGHGWRRTVHRSPDRSSPPRPNEQPRPRRRRGAPVQQAPRGCCSVHRHLDNLDRALEAAEQTYAGNP